MQAEEMAVALVDGAFTNGGYSMTRSGSPVREAFVVGGVQTLCIMEAADDLATRNRVAEFLKEPDIDNLLNTHAVGSWIEEGNLYIDLITDIVGPDDDALWTAAHSIAAFRSELSFGYISSDGEFTEYPVVTKTATQNKE